MSLRNRAAAAGKSKKRLELLPASLEIYVTSSCNLRCAYCSSLPLISGPAKKLSFEQVRRAVDLFASYCAPGRGAGADTKFRVVSLTGGEPLLEFGLAARAIDYIRNNYKWLSVTLSTNGLLLDREKAAFLLARDVDLTVSLDGPRKVTDLNRKLASGGGSVFGAVLSRLKALSAEQRGQMRVMATFSSRTLPALAESVAFLNTLGFAAIEADFDMYGLWSRKDLGVLRKSLAGMRRFYLRRFGYGGWTADWGNVFSGSFQNKVPNAGKYDIFNEFALSCDGRFYPADVTGLFGRAAYAVGDLERGVDFAKLEKIYDRVSAFLRSGGFLDSAAPPVNRYFYAVSNGRSPAAMLQNSRRLTEVFAEELGGLLEVEKIFRRLARSREFGDFVHAPKSRSRAEIGALALDWGGKGPGAARRAADYFLYSPGAAKELRLTAGRGAPEYARGLLLYSVLKAGYLKKKLRACLEPRGGTCHGEN